MKDRDYKRHVGGLPWKQKQFPYDSYLDEQLLLVFFTSPPGKQTSSGNFFHYFSSLNMPSWKWDSRKQAKNIT